MMQKYKSNNLSVMFSMLLILATILMLFGLIWRDLNNMHGWQKVAEMQTERYEGAIAEYKDKIYFLGGFHDEKRGLAKTNEVYDVATGQMGFIKPMINLKSHMGVARVDDEFWLVGGFLDGFPGKVVDDVQIYNVTNDEWRIGPKLPINIGSGGLAYAGGKLHFFGGVLEDRLTDSPVHFVIDPKKPENGWKKLENQPLARNFFGTMVVGDRIILAGGWKGQDGTTEVLADVYGYNYKTNTWKKLASLPEPHSHFELSQAVINGKYTILGGRGIRQRSSNNIFVYDHVSDVWSKNGALPKHLLGPTSVYKDGSLYVAGGGAGTFYYPQKSIYKQKIDEY
jgi:N-acetylneuraminic acid mutarotase